MQAGSRGDTQPTSAEPQVAQEESNSVHSKPVAAETYAQQLASDCEVNGLTQPSPERMPAGEVEAWHVESAVGAPASPSSTAAAAIDLARDHQQSVGHAQQGQGEGPGIAGQLAAQAPPSPTTEQEQEPWHETRPAKHRAADKKAQASAALSKVCNPARQKKLSEKLFAAPAGQPRLPVPNPMSSAAGRRSGQKAPQHMQRAQLSEAPAGQNGLAMPGSEGASADLQQHVPAAASAALQQRVQAQPVQGIKGCEHQQKLCFGTDSESAAVSGSICFWPDESPLDRGQTIAPFWQQHNGNAGIASQQLVRSLSPLILASKIL